TPSVTIATSSRPAAPSATATLTAGSDALVVALGIVRVGWESCGSGPATIEVEGCAPGGGSASEREEVGAPVQAASTCRAQTTTTPQTLLLIPISRSGRRKNSRQRRPVRRTRRLTNEELAPSAGAGASRGSPANENRCPGKTRRRRHTRYTNRHSGLHPGSSTPGGACLRASPVQLPYVDAHPLEGDHRAPAPL